MDTQIAVLAFVVFSVNTESSFANVIDQVENIFRDLHDIVDALDGFSAVKMILPAINSLLGRRVRPLLTILEETLLTIIDSIENKLNSIVKRHTQPTTAAINTVVNIVRGIVPALEPSLNAIVTLLNGIIKNINEIVIGLLRIIQRLVDNIVQNLFRLVGDHTETAANNKRYKGVVHI